jgi:hypothetical protein
MISVGFARRSRVRTVCSARRPHRTITLPAAINREEVR